jgi:hypothetical protein
LKVQKEEEILAKREALAKQSAEGEAIATEGEEFAFRMREGEGPGAKVGELEKKISAQEEIRPETRINDISYGEFIGVVRKADWAGVRGELKASSQNFTHEAFDHHFNPLNLMGRLMDAGMPFVEARALVKQYDVESFRPIRQGLVESGEFRARMGEKEQEPLRYDPSVDRHNGEKLIS